MCLVNRMHNILLLELSGVDGLLWMGIWVFDLHHLPESGWYSLAGGVTCQNEPLFLAFPVSYSAFQSMVICIKTFQWQLEHLFSIPCSLAVNRVKIFMNSLKIAVFYEYWNENCIKTASNCNYLIKTLQNCWGYCLIRTLTVLAELLWHQIHINYYM